MYLQNQHLIIRDWEKTDREALARYANNRNVWDQLRDHFPSPYTESLADQWIEYCRSEKFPPSFAIEFEGEAVGSIGLILRNDIERMTGELGYWIGEPHWNKGIVSHAIRLFIPEMFRLLGLVRIEAKVFDYNIGSMRVLEKTGFQKEAILKRAAIKNNQIIDLQLFVRFREDEAMLKNNITESKNIFIKY